MEVCWVRGDGIRSGKGGDCTNLYIKHIVESVTEEDLYDIFCRFGPIKSVLIEKDQNGKSKKFGFVSFHDEDSATAALLELADKEIPGVVQEAKTLFLSPAQKKAARQQQLKQRHEIANAERDSQHDGCNLYVKNLEHSCTDEDLSAAFDKFGEIASAKVMRKESGESLGFGFVCFHSKAEAAKALTRMDGRVIGSKPVAVSLAQRKEDRQQMLDEKFGRNVSKNGVTTSAYSARQRTNISG